MTQSRGLVEKLLAWALPFNSVGEGCGCWGYQLPKPLLLFFFFLACKACEISVPPPGIEPMSPALAWLNFNHWTTREVSKPLFSTTGLMERAGEGRGEWVGTPSLPGAHGEVG